jgi:NAD dependent epimerase/dehydratase
MESEKLMLVTGADGFIGSHLTEHLLGCGYRVRALVQYNSFNSFGWLDGLESTNLQVISGDIRDPFFCQILCKDVDTVFHLAALIAIPYSYVAPQSYVQTNVTGTLNMCQAALNCGVRRFLHTSTSEVYGTARFVPISEEHPLQPQSPYSASKIGADQMALSYYHSFGMHVTVVRPFNTYGPRQSARAVIPTIISQIAAGKRNISLGDLRPTRDFNYVSDTAEAFATIAAADMPAGEVINVASNYEVSVGDTLRTIAELMSADIEVNTDEQRLRPDNSEVFRLWGANEKLKRLTGFSPQTTLEDGLNQTIAWFMDKENLMKYKTGIYNV